MTPLFKILQPAILTQLQDLGRFGQLHRGISVSGAMDETSFRLNNQLLDNSENAAQLEIAPGGLALEVLADCMIAIAGAYAMPTVDGKPLVNYHSYRVQAGQQLKMGYPKQGQYSYLAVQGGFQATPILGSLSTCARLELYPQRLGRGSLLFGETFTEFPSEQGVRWQAQPNRTEAKIEVIPAYQYDDFTEAAKQAFIEQKWRVQSSDRMGTLLSASNPVQWQGGELLSEGIIAGAVQISNNGMPIVLQKDAQSIGGYPKIGVLTGEARSRLAQMKAGSTIQFVFIDA
ncbi:biotin-dependent carboxyltransferase family protein [Suttonella ornithocola]|uniref:Allophanate hydrolase subunit 2 n=1 Tax=Suttonella ornithocola TaxID=279832 RepID=A0A380MSH7_9GAMM|nr:biotin-dependent carboxyltransferase family protein [Suttonella ornithocola]SUO95016.1 Allophanate hydrolase subunit 2 [Suttonella ornithocola]